MAASWYTYIWMNVMKKFLICGLRNKQYQLRPNNQFTIWDQNYGEGRIYIKSIVVILKTQEQHQRVISKQHIIFLFLGLQNQSYQELAFHYSNDEPMHLGKLSSSLGLQINAWSPSQMNCGSYHKFNQWDAHLRGETHHSCERGTTHLFVVLDY